jgi:peroxiredoxin
VVQFTRAAGLSFDAKAFFGNDRSQRYAAIVDDGVVQDVFIEKVPTEVTVSSASHVLGAL